VGRPGALGSSIWAAMMLMAKINSKRNIAMIPAWPGSWWSSSTPRSGWWRCPSPEEEDAQHDARDSAATPWMDMGLSQDQWKLVEPCGWVAATLMMPRREEDDGDVLDDEQDHWKLVVQRMPRCR